MTKEQVRKFFHEAGELAGWKPGMGNELVINYLTHFATLVRNAALEEAKQKCEAIEDKYQRCEGRRYPELKSDAETGAGECATAIESLKEPTT